MPTALDVVDARCVSVRRRRRAGGRTGDRHRAGPVTGQEGALRAAEPAVEDQTVDVADLRLAYVPADADCDAVGCSPTPAPGDELSVCVTVTMRIPRGSVTGRCRRRSG